MNLEESDIFVQENEKNARKRKMILFFIVICAILIVILFLMICYMRYQDSQKLKMYLDGKEFSFSSSFLTSIDDNIYVNLEQITSLFGYDYQKGEYKKYNENPDSCYISNGIETVAITAGTNIFTKYIDVTEDKIFLGEQEITVNNLDGYSETFNAKNEIKLVEDKIYIPFENVQDIFNVMIDTSTKNRIRMYTLENRFANVGNVMAKLGNKYTQVSGEYENIKALAYGLAVVGSGDVYGVISTITGKEIIGPKYSKMQFIQNSQEFLVNAENTVGLISKEGTTIIPPTEYDEISLLDDELGLYTVKKGNKYGVLNRDGDIVIYVENERIGLSDVEQYSAKEIKNGTLLFNKSIPVYRDKKYGLYSIDGKEELGIEYSNFGYTVKREDETSEESVLIIPEEVGIQGIVVASERGYGIYDINSDSWILGDVCSKIFARTKSGKTSYYFVYNDAEYDLEQYLEENNLKTISDTESKENSNENDEQNDNEVQSDENSGVVENNYEETPNEEAQE